MKLVKYLTPELEKAEAKDRFYQIDGTIEHMLAPRQYSRSFGKSQSRGDKCWSFKVENKHIMIPWGTNFGIFKNALRRSIRAQKKGRYSAAPIDLMRVYPVWLDAGKAPCESMKDGKEPQCLFTKRRGKAESTRVEEFFDYIENRPFKCFMEVDSENPINEEKFVALIKTLDALATACHGKWGKLKIEKVVRVELLKDEIEKLSEGEPVEPVVY